VVAWLAVVAQTAVRGAPAAQWEREAASAAWSTARLGLVPAAAGAASAAVGVVVVTQPEEPDEPDDEQSDVEHAEADHEDPARGAHSLPSMTVAAIKPIVPL